MFGADSSNGSSGSNSSSTDEDSGTDEGRDSEEIGTLAPSKPSAMTCHVGPDWIPTFLTPKERIAKKVEEIREQNQGGRGKDGRRAGGLRTKDNELKQRNVFTEDTLKEAMHYSCACGGHCCGWFDLEDIRFVRSETYSWNCNNERSGKVFDDIMARIVVDPYTRQSTLHYFLEGIEVCQDAYFFIRYGNVHPSTKTRILLQLEAGASEWETKWATKMEPVIRADGLKRDACVYAIYALARTYGDLQSDDRAEVQEIHLDPGMTKGFLYYHDYLDACIAKTEAPASYSYFMYLWSTAFGKAPMFSVDGVKYRIVVRDEARKKKFHECSKCSSFKQRLANCRKGDYAAKQLIREERTDHYTKEVRVEKQLYYQRRAEGRETMRQEHDGALSLIMDGEDKSSHRYPHQPRAREDLEKVSRMQLKIQGILIHGLCLLLYMIPPWLGSGAGMAITCLLHALWLAKQHLPKLPSRLYIQSDNGSENKNKAMLYMLLLLCHLHVFQVIEWHLLIPGHTHEDIDAWFSIVSRWLVKVYITSLSELCNR